MKANSGPDYFLTVPEFLDMLGEALGTQFLEGQRCHPEDLCVATESSVEAWSGAVAGVVSAMRRARP